MGETIQKYVGIVIMLATVIGYVVTSSAYVLGLEAKIEALDASVAKNAKSGSNALAAYKQEQLVLQEFTKARLPMVLSNSVDVGWIRSTCCSELESTYVIKE